jgi:hypothetical protein
VSGRANTFLAFFGAAFLLARGVEARGLALRCDALHEAFFRHFAASFAVVILLQIGGVVWLVGRKIPTTIDNAYRHLNRDDNLGSRRRVRA